MEQKDVTSCIVLIIDDDESMRDSCRQVLEKQGIHVEAVSDGKKGLETAEVIKPDVVILDLKMPGHQGIDVLKELRKSDSQSVVIVITGYPSIETGIETMKCGAYDFLIKPFTPQELRIAIKSAIEHRIQIRRTEVRKHEEEEIRKNFAKILSFQLKAPLVSIEESLLQLDQEIAGSNMEKQKHLVNRIHFRVKHLLTMIDNFMRVNGEKNNVSLSI